LALLTGNLNSLSPNARDTANDPNTLLIATADHETGGLGLGLNFPNSTYPLYAWYPQKLLQMNKSTDFMASRILAGAAINNTISQYSGVNDLTPEELNLLQSASLLTNDPTHQYLNSVIGSIIAKRCNIGWTTRGHTASDVNLYAHGLHSELLRGNYDNTQVGNFVADAFGLDLVSQTARLKDFNPVPPAKSARFEDGLH